MSRTVTPGATVAAIITLLVFAPPASADIVWSWSFGTEAGTFTTEGSPADLAAPVDLEIIDFQVTASSVPANVGDTYTVDDPDQGILWDGSQITQFYRS